MIPKTINYCWFGGKPLPAEAREYIESWKKYCPDYAIKEWNESNFDINCCTYVRQAYDSKKWAFVSDYARFWILYNYGGVYFDTDVEVVKSFENLLCGDGFMGKEAKLYSYDGDGDLVKANAGLGLAASPGLSLYREILEYYERQTFIDENGTMNLLTVVNRVTDILKQHGYKGDMEIENICGITIYPPEFFCPLNPDTGKLNITKNTISIHHYSETWHTDLERKVVAIGRKFAGKGKLVYILGRIVTLPLRVKAKFEISGIDGVLNTIKRKLVGGIGRE